MRLSVFLHWKFEAVEMIRYRPKNRADVHQQYLVR